MKKLLLIGVLFLSLTNKIRSQALIQIGSTMVSVDTAYTGLSIPWEVIYGPDNYLWVTERKGLLSRIDPVYAYKNCCIKSNGFYICAI